MSENYFMLDGKQTPMSEETVASLRAKRDEHVWKHGDVGSNPSIRIFLEINGVLEVFGNGCMEKPWSRSKYVPTVQVRAKKYNYEYLGNLFDGTYKL